MAYTGTGTKSDPFIVDNWTDFVSVCNVANAYIKWADRAVKTVPSITISNSINSQFTFVDFNGWTFEKIIIDLPGEEWVYRVFIDTSGGDITVCNWTVKRLELKNFDVEFFIDERDIFYSCYFEEIIYPEVPEHSYFQREGIDRPLFSHAYYCYFKFVLRGCSMIVPSINCYYCIEEIDYKSLPDTVPLENQSLFNHVRFYNSCITGKIDFSDSSGEYNLFSNYQIINISRCVLNLQIIGSSNVQITQKHNPSTYGNGLFVLNNGDYYDQLKDIVPQEYGCFLNDIKNIDYLISKGFGAKKDDNFRNAQYNDYINLTKDEKRNLGDWTWRQHPVVNQGIVFLPFWFYPLSPAPQPAEPVEETPYITVYDMATKQNDFNNHGLGVLQPTQCRIIEELNGEYTVSMVHPIDEEGMWQTLLEMNIIKDLGQLFVIQRVDEVQRGGSGYISLYAEHISYTLNDLWIFPPFSVMGYYGQTLIDSIMAQATDMGGDWQTRYNFAITTNINAPDDFYDWGEMKDGATPYEMLLGSNGFIAKLGGELYRDNFTLSIQDRMQGAQDNAFEMAIGYNLTGIKRTVDLSTFCTYFRGYDVSDGNYETWFAVSWDPSTLPRAYPRNVVRSQNFTYEHPETAFGQLERDTMAFFNANCAPLISYELNIIDLKRNPDFKMFTNNYRYKVGDKGRVWDERLQTWLELEITRTEKDGITGDCSKVVVGTQRSFTRPTGYNPIIPPMVIPSANKTIEGLSPLAFYSNGDPLVDYTIFGDAGGVGEMSNNLHYGGIDYGFYNPSNGQFSPSSSWIASNELIKIEPDTTYTFSLQYKPVDLLGLFVIEYDDNGNYITSSYGNTSASVTSYTFTTSATTKFIRCEITGIGSYGVSDFGDFNLNEGSTQLPYEPYGCMITVTISDGTHTQTIQITANEPLEEGDSISMSEAGTVIPTYEGLCSIDVLATVQPRIRITYKEG